MPILILALNTRAPTVLQKQKDGEILNLCNNFIILKVQSCKLYNSKYMIASSQITNTEILAVIAVLIFKLLSCKVLFINRKDNRNKLLKSRLLLKKIANLTSKLLQNYK